MNSKVQSILSYLGVLWLIAYFAGKNERDDFSRYHLKQGLGLFLVSIALNLLSSIIVLIAPKLVFVIGLLALFLFIVLVIGIIHAVNEVKKPLPFIGKIFEDKFGFI